MMEDKLVSESNQWSPAAHIKKYLFSPPFLFLEKKERKGK